MSLPIPEEALDQHVAILAKTRAGKSYTSRGLIEWMLDQGRRVCIIDPTGVHWGIRLQADGKTPSRYPMVIFGGVHADVPIDANSGAKLGKIVSTTDIRCVIDVKGMSVKSRTLLFRDFAEALMQHNTEPLHLVIDECHLFMPKGRVTTPQSGQMLRNANDMISGGRALGLRVLLISQRAAKVHNDALSCAETLIILRMTLPHDKRAIGEWVKDSAEPGEWEKIRGTLAALPIGTGWVWAPDHELLERVEFPAITTFDSMRAPRPGDTKATTTKLPAADLAKITAELAVPPTEKPAVGKRAAVTVHADPDVLSDLRAELTQAHQHLRATEESRRQLAGALNQILRVATAALEQHGDAPEPDRSIAAPPPRQPRAAATPARPAAPAGDDPLVAMARSIWPVKLTWGQLCALCGRKARGGHFNAVRKRLVEEGIVREEGGRVVLSDPPDLGDAIPADVLEQVLPNPARQMFAAIRANPGVMDVLGLGNTLGLQPRGGHWNTGMHILRSNDLIREDGGVLSINPELEGGR